MNAMAKLRQLRRRKGLCAECAEPSVSYICDQCDEKRKNQKRNREELRLAQNLCIQCGKGEIFNKEKSICEACNNIYPNLPIRKLRKWQVKNHSLYQAMMNKPCTTKELSEFVNVNQRTVCKWIFNNSTPKLHNAMQVAEFLNKEVDDLFHMHFKKE